MTETTKITYDYFLHIMKGTETIIKKMRDENTDQLNTLAGQIGMLKDLISNMEGLKEDLEEILKQTSRESSS
jgi:hypothetical protein